MDVTAGDARTRLFRLVEQVNTDEELAEIVSSKGSGFLVSTAQFHSTSETA